MIAALNSKQTDFLSHLSGDEEIVVLYISVIVFLSHLSGDEGRRTQRSDS